MKYFGNWKTHEDVHSDFVAYLDKQYDHKTNRYIVTNPLPEFPSAGDLLFACYDTPSYEGYAFVLFLKDGQPFEVNASHCSCYGLEGQWTPEATTWEALAMRTKGGGLWEIKDVSGAAEAFQRIVNRHLKVKP